MKKWFVLVAVVLFGAATAPAQQPRKRVAVVLSGGGAKGMAHIGALKVIERAGIPIDIITGTSMGSLIGGLYSIGYDAHRLDSMVRVQEWNFLLSDRADVSRQSIESRHRQNTYIISKDITFGSRTSPLGEGYIVGKNLSSLFSKLTAGYRDSMDFNKLPIPFACVATNIIDNTEYDFHSGVLYEAMRTSMSIPGVFAPIRKGDMLLVDGGLRNNFPVDIARRMGADVVIGVTVQGPAKTAGDIKDGMAVLGQIVDVNCKNKYLENMANTDVLIRADTRGYSAASFNSAAIDTLIRRGEEEALKHWDELIALKREIGVDDAFVPRKIVSAEERALPERFRVHRFVFTDVSGNDRQYLRRKYRLDRRDSLSATDLDEIISAMRVDLYYNDADVYTHQHGDGYDVEIVAKDKKTSQVNLGVRFDTEEMVAMQANAGFMFRTRFPLKADVTLRLGKRIMVRGDLAFSPVAFGRMKLSYLYRHNDLNVYHEGDRAYNTTYNEHQVNLNVFDFNVRNFNFSIGARFDYFNIHNVLTQVSTEQPMEDLSDDHFFSYHADVTYNSEDKWNFPSRGARFSGRFAYYTDNFAGYQGHAGFSSLSAMWRMNFTLHGRLTFQPMAYGRLLFGREIPVEKQNVIGGEWFGHYLDDQMPFAGVGYVEHTDNQFVAFQLKAQLRIMDNNYIHASVVGAQHAGQLKDLLRHGPMTGCQLGYDYNSMFGPLGATLGYSTKTHDPYFYINLGFEF